MSNSSSFNYDAKKRISSRRKKKGKMKQKTLLLGL